MHDSLPIFVTALVAYVTMVAFDINPEQNLIIDTNMAFVLHTTSARKSGENIIIQS
jgi:hypothetical protein